MDNKIISKDTASIPLFFIIGRPRSGTTLLRFLFEAHPEVLIPPESPFIINLYKKYGKVTHWDEEKIRSFIRDLMKQRYFDKWLINEDELFDHLLECEGETSFQTIVKQVCLAYQSVFTDKKITVIGDKNPGYSLYVNRIHKLFPGSKIIHLTRDYRDNYLSLIKVNFEVPVVPLVVYRWKFAIQRMWQLKKRNPELIYSLRYEDLVEEPGQKFRDLCHFLGISYDPSVLAFYQKKEEVEKAYAGSEEIRLVHQSLFNPISTARMDIWQTEMSSRQVRIADLVAGKTAERAGYKRKYIRFNPVLYLLILPVIIYGWAMYRMILLGDRFPYRMSNGLNRMLGVFLKIYWTMNKRKIKPL
jgi:hypothetical protein